jgi:anti-sigma regulatory factor (Ser/Thr protein kinase)
MPPREVGCSLPPTTASVPAARRFVRDALVAWRCPVDSDVAQLLASEIVTNAVLHARTDAYLSVRFAPDHVRVEVHDRSRALPARRPFDPNATSGRGLTLVDAYSSGWGAEADGPGKVVWFELSCARRTEAQ